MSDNINDMTEATRLLEKSNAMSTHYTERPEIIGLLSQLFPETIPRLANITKPTISNKADQLERWETAKRLQRMKDLSQASPRDKLVMMLYEESFGVNATPGLNIEYRHSLAPSPGGLLSHGQSNFISHDAPLEEVIKLNLAGGNLLEVINNQPGLSEKSMLASQVANIAYPPSLHEDFLTETRRRSTERLLMTSPEKLSNIEELTNWSLRYLRLIQLNPSLLDKVEDTSAREILNLKHGAYLSPSSATAETAYIHNLRSLLLVRTTPEFQLLFKYHSASGYLNQQS